MTEQILSKKKGNSLINNELPYLICRDTPTRTEDPLLPKQMRYPTAPHPDYFNELAMVRSPKRMQRYDYFLYFQKKIKKNYIFSVFMHGEGMGQHLF